MVKMEVKLVHLVKDVENIPMELRQDAMRVMNKLRAGERVFGNPAEGLKITLKHLEAKMAQSDVSRSKLQYLDDNADLMQQIAMLKAGINGEEGLAEWLETVVKYDEVLEDIVFFASLSDPDQDSGNGEYVSDSDFIAVYGDHVLIMDAKNIRTNPEVPIYLDGNSLVSVGGKEIMQLHPSVYVWQQVFDKFGIELESIHGCVVVVNNSGATVWRNQEWHHSEVKPLHISDLVKHLHQWMDGKQGNTRLSVLAAVASMQIKKEGAGLDLSDVRKRFRI